MAQQGNNHGPQRPDSYGHQQRSAHRHRHTEACDPLQKAGKQPADQKNQHQLILGFGADQLPDALKDPCMLQHFIQKDCRPDYNQNIQGAESAFSQIHRRNRQAGLSHQQGRYYGAEQTQQRRPVCFHMKDTHCRK